MVQNKFTRLTGQAPTLDNVAQVLQSLLEDPDVPPEFRARAEALLHGGHTDPGLPMPPEVAARVEGMQERAAQRMRTVGPEVKQRAGQLLQAALQAGTAAKRVLWLQRAADGIGQGYAEVAACQAGCSHCCLIPVKISQAEAQVMGKAIGCTPVPVNNHGSETRTGDWIPCTFLQAGQCSIYVHRPAVCRSHLNLDEDDLLCRPLPGVRVPVPYLDVAPHVVASIDIAGNAPWADIRQWFPPVGTAAVGTPALQEDAHGQ